jgi:hypothetical protein
MNKKMNGSFWKKLVSTLLLAVLGETFFSLLQKINGKKKEENSKALSNSIPTEVSNLQ